MLRKATRAISALRSDAPGASTVAPTAANTSSMKNALRPVLTPTFYRRRRGAHEPAIPPDRARAVAARTVGGGGPLLLVASPAALALHLAFPADKYSDQKGDGDRQEDPVNPVATREVPKSYASLDRADNTEHAIVRGDTLHQHTLPAMCDETSWSVGLIEWRDDWRAADTPVQRVQNGRSPPLPFSRITRKCDSDVAPNREAHPWMRPLREAQKTGCGPMSPYSRLHNTVFSSSRFGYITRKGDTFFLAVGLGTEEECAREAAPSRPRTPTPSPSSKAPRNPCGEITPECWLSLFPHVAVP